MSRNVSISSIPPTRTEHRSTRTEVTKVCHIVKRPNFDGYGFNLHSEKAKVGRYIGKVDANSPAEAAGLREGDRIIGVNGVAIHNETHKQVVRRIKASGCEVRLLLIDTDGGKRPTKAEEHSAMVQKMAVPSSGNSEQSRNGDLNHSSSQSQRESTHTASSITNHNSILANVAGNGHLAGTYFKNDNRKVMLTPPPPSVNIVTASQNSNSSSSINASYGRTESLQLTMTAAEMRTKVMSRKKYDPKNDHLNLMKKFEIIQKL